MFNYRESYYCGNNGISTALKRFSSRNDVSVVLTSIKHDNTTKTQNGARLRIQVVAKHPRVLNPSVLVQALCICVNVKLQHNLEKFINFCMLFDIRKKTVMNHCSCNSYPYLLRKLKKI